MTPLSILVILILGLHLATDQCKGSRRSSPSMKSESATFSCSQCRPNTMYDPYVCKYCYKGAEEGSEAFSCQRCKIGATRSKPFICDECESNPQESAPGAQTQSHL